MLLLRAPAKLNLGLRILGRRDDGYHEIETVFLPLRLYDELELCWSETPGIQLDLSGHAASGLPTGPENLVTRAALATCAALGATEGLRIRLEKRIPIAAGLGGGSSDAAATIRGVEQLAGKRLADEERRSLALRLGADVSFFLDPRPALGEGVGERLRPLPDVPEMWWLLLALPFPVSTAEAYRLAGAELTPNRGGSSIAALLGASGLNSSPPNDLEAVVARRHPEIGEARRELERVGAIATGMSGSGPTVYGRFPDREAAELAAGEVRRSRGAVTITVSSPGSA